jgi:hypothetical protein
VSGAVTAGVVVCVLSGGAAISQSSEAFEDRPKVHLAVGSMAAAEAPNAAFEHYLDRLMRSESNGRDDAKNPRSSALGAYQFIKSTFLEVMRRHFPDAIENLKEHEILALRTDRGFARRAAAAFSKDNLDYLKERGLTPTFGHLRLAFLLGPSAAARVMEAEPGKQLTQVLDGAVISANPFMRRMTAGDLIARATRDIGVEVPTQVAEAVRRAGDPAAEPARLAEVEADEAAPEAEAASAKTAAAEPAAAQQPAPAEQPAPSAQPEQKVAAADATAPVPAPVPATRPESPAGADKDEAPAARKPAARAARPTGRTYVLNVTCRSRLASCQRWINQQVNKLVGIKVAGGGRPGA